MKGSKKKKQRARSKAEWQKLILEEGYSLRVFSDIHWRVFVYGVSVDIWPTTGSWKLEGEEKKKGIYEFQEFVDKLAEEQDEMKRLDERFKELTK